MDEVKARLALLEGQVQAGINGAAEALSSQLSNLTQQNEDMVRVNDMLIQQNSDLSHQAEALMSQNRHTISQNTRLAHEVHALENRLNEINATVSAANLSIQKCCALNQSVADLQQQVVHDLSLLNQTVQRHTSRINANQQECFVLLHQAEGLSDQSSQRSALLSVINQNVEILQEMQVNYTTALHSALQDRVYFQARTDPHTQHPVGSDGHITMNSVIIDSDSTYKPATSTFVAPRSGTYFFIATAALSNDCHPDPGHHCHANFGIMANYRDLDSVRVEHPSGHGKASGTAHAVVHLNQGDRVWLQNYPEQDDPLPSSATFSGFLLIAD